MAQYDVDCKDCSRRFEIDWDGDQRLLPTSGTCPHCGHADGYGEDDVLLIGAFQVSCPKCGEVFQPDIPAHYIDYHAPTGLRSPLALGCKLCGTTSAFQANDVAWLGEGASMPEARALGVGQQRA